jgi:hypothetical protein
VELSYFSYLGSGRFCVTRFFRETDNDGRFIMTVVVTAVEATRALPPRHRGVANGQPGVRALPQPRVRFALLGVLMRVCLTA